MSNNAANILHQCFAEILKDKGWVLKYKWYETAKNGMHYRYIRNLTTQVVWEVTLDPHPTNCFNVSFSIYATGQKIYTSRIGWKTSVEDMELLIQKGEAELKKVSQKKVVPTVPKNKHVWRVRLESHNPYGSVSELGDFFEDYVEASDYADMLVKCRGAFDWQSKERQTTRVHEMNVGGWKIDGSSFDNSDHSLTLYVECVEIRPKKC